MNHTRDGQDTYIIKICSTIARIAKVNSETKRVIEITNASAGFTAIMP